MLRMAMIFAPMVAATAVAAPVGTGQYLAVPFSTEAIRAAPGEPGAPLVELLPFATDKTERMTVKVRIGGNGPFAFLVDTGSERTSISRQLAVQLGLAGGSGVKVHSVLGSKTVSTVRIPHLVVGRQSVSVANAPTFERSHIGADGLLGIDSLRSQQVLFDFKAGEMHIVPSRREPEGAEDENTIIVRAKSRYGRLVLTKAKLDGIAIAVIIDTGAQLSIGNPALRERLLRAGRISAPDPGTLSRDRALIESVTGEVQIVDLARIKRLDLGGVELRRIGVAFASSRIFGQLGYGDRPALLLGIDAMRAFDRVAIDFANKRVQFVVPPLGMRDGYRSTKSFTAR